MDAEFTTPQLATMEGKRGIASPPTEIILLKERGDRTPPMDDGSPKLLSYLEDIASPPTKIIMKEPGDRTPPIDGSPKLLSDLEDIASPPTKIILLTEPGDRTPPMDGNPKLLSDLEDTELTTLELATMEKGRSLASPPMKKEPSDQALPTDGNTKLPPSPSPMEGNPKLQPNIINQVMKRIRRLALQQPEKTCSLTGGWSPLDDGINPYGNDKAELLDHPLIKRIAIDVLTDTKLYGSAALPDAPPRRRLPIFEQICPESLETNSPIVSFKDHIEPEI